MVRMFCTLKEAAETLNTSEDLIEILLKKGILHEFRDGPHRLLKETDVDELVAGQNRRRTNRPLSQAQIQAREPQSGEPWSEDGDDIYPPPAAVRRARVRDTSRPQTSRRKSKKSQARRRQDRDRRHSPTRRVESLPPGESLSVRQWLWTGLLQDRPIAIALLSGLILLLLAALVAGACFALEAF